MNKKINILEIIFGKIPKNIENLEKTISLGYEEYLSKPQEDHDKVIKRMFRKTKYADESPEKLREILRSQFSVKKY